MKTWVFFGGRWRVITPRGAGGLILMALVLTWALGTLTGLEIMIHIYQNRIDQIQKHIDVLEYACKVTP